jgi:hypothetical protein
VFIGEAEDTDQGVRARPHCEVFPAHSFFDRPLRVLGRSLACCRPDQQQNHCAQEHPAKTDHRVTFHLRLGDILFPKTYRMFTFKK